VQSKKAFCSEGLFCPLKPIDPAWKAKVKSPASGLEGKNTAMFDRRADSQGMPAK
jgi:hypothetical protein